MTRKNLSPVDFSLLALFVVGLLPGTEPLHDLYGHAHFLVPWIMKSLGK